MRLDLPGLPCAVPKPSIQSYSVERIPIKFHDLVVSLILMNKNQKIMNFL